MRKKQVNIEVNQSIVYAETKQHDKWNFHTMGDLLELETFSKLSYENDEGQRTEVKWQVDSTENQWIVEIKQGKNVLRFNPTQETQVHYLTEQGLLHMTLQTSLIRWSFEQTEAGHTRRHLTIDYQLKLDDASIGDYRYNLIYIG